ncbi:MAG: hypothetical protein R3A44_12995 [Caldilineaceae bacterium]
MPNMLLTAMFIEQSPIDFLESFGEIFAVFDARTQDSGNISYGVQVGAVRYFVKTAGAPDDPQPFLAYLERVALLRNAVQLAQSVQYSLLPHLHNVIESPRGPLLVYDWVEGELLHASRAQRADPQSAYQRFRRLPVEEILPALDFIFELHDELTAKNWIAVDFYDGSLIYDFAQRRLSVVDLDNYHRGPFVNAMGRMFGSSRFMAPEEFELGAQIDQWTNVFTMGRTAAEFLGDGTLDRQPFRGDDALHAVMLRACCARPADRFQSMAEFYKAWCAARG